MESNIECRLLRFYIPTACISDSDERKRKLGQLGADSPCMPAFSLNDEEYGDTQYSIDSSDLEKIRKQCIQDGLRYQAKIERRTSDQVQLVGDYDRSTYAPSNKLFSYNLI